MLKLTVASPSFLLEFGRLIVNVPVSVGETPDSAAAASEAAMLTIAGAAKACGTIAFHPKDNTTSRSANWKGRPTVEPFMRAADFWKVDLIGEWIRRRGLAEAMACRTWCSSNSWYVGIKRTLGLGQGLVKWKQNRNGEHDN